MKTITFEIGSLLLGREPVLSFFGDFSHFLNYMIWGMYSWILVLPWRMENRYHEQILNQLIKRYLFIVNQANHDLLHIFSYHTDSRAELVVFKDNENNKSDDTPSDIILNYMIWGMYSWILVLPWRMENRYQVLMNHRFPRGIQQTLKQI